MPRIRNGQKHAVDQFTLDDVFVKRWQSATIAAKHFNTSQGNISAAARGDRNKAQGFKWKYCEEEVNINEEWRNHPTLNIKTSNIGRIALTNNHHTYGQSLRDGYYRIRISNGSTRNNYSVHRLIAESWFPDEKHAADIRCNYKAQVDHIDGNPSNNNVDNLRWCTPSENIKFRYERIK